MLADEVAEAFDRVVLVAVEVYQLLLAARRIEDRAVQCYELRRGCRLLPQNLQVRRERRHNMVLQLE